MIKKIYIARHGFRLNWISTRWHSETGLPRDPPLAAFGVNQAKELADHFLSMPAEEKPTAIFSSPYYRCLQTAKPTAIALGIPIFVEHGLSEWYSPVVPGTGLHPRPGSATSLKTYFPEIDPSWSTVWYPSREGEDVEELHKRTSDFLNLFIPEVERNDHERILVLSHAATVIGLTRTLLADRSMPMRVGCCTLTELVRSDAPSSWEAKRVADGTHLTEQDTLREWGFEDIEIADGKVVHDPGVPGTEGEEDYNSGSQLQLSSNL